MPRDRDLVWDSSFGKVKSGPRTREVVPAGDGIVRIRRETGGRGGKTVTTISGVPVVPSELKVLAKHLKKACGVGGAVKDHVIEIQGDHRDKVEAELVRRGYTVKRAGG